METLTLSRASCSETAHEPRGLSPPGRWTPQACSGSSLRGALRGADSHIKKEEKREERNKGSERTFSPGVRECIRDAQPITPAARPERRGAAQCVLRSSSVACPAARMPAAPVSAPRPPTSVSRRGAQTLMSMRV
eukprot:scaffold25696_cov66-Phaeocystis_antarctica.AAC.3